MSSAFYGALHAAIEATPDVAGHWQPGKQALGSYRARVSFADNDKSGGSLDIDSALLTTYPNAARWEYALMYDGCVVYIDVHPAASGGNINEVLAKVKWLRQWLATSAPALHKLPKYAPAFVWVASGSTDLRPSGAQRIALGNAGIKAVSRLAL